MRNNFEELYDKQIAFQKQIVSKKENYELSDDIMLPNDDINWFKYHTLAMLEELGEVLKADKRWKTHRNERFEYNEKIDELADVAITFINMCIFSDLSSDDVLNAINNKINENFERLNKVK